MYIIFLFLSKSRFRSKKALRDLAPQWERRTVSLWIYATMWFTIGQESDVTVEKVWKPTLWTIIISQGHLF